MVSYISELSSPWVSTSLPVTWLSPRQACPGSPSAGAGGAEAKVEGRTQGYRYGLVPLPPDDIFHYLYPHPRKYNK